MFLNANILKYKRSQMDIQFVFKWGEEAETAVVDKINHVLTNRKLQINY